MTDEKNTISSRIFSIVLIGFFLNLLWEVLHSELYDWDKPPLVNDIYDYCIRITFFASAFDAIWIISFILLNSLIQREFDWLLNPQKRDYIIFIVLGIITAIIIELHAIIFNMWSYNEYMPQIFGVGLTPLIQLAITSYISLYITAHIQWNKA